MNIEYSENELSKIIFGCALKVHKALGPGLLESAYLKLTGSKLGMLINFNVALIKKEIKRVVNNL